MQIDWDVEVPMDDGQVVRADVYRPAGDGRYPVLMSYGPYGKGLHFDDGYPIQWRSLTAKHPEILRGSSGRYATGKPRILSAGCRSATSACESTRAAPGARLE